MPPTPEVSLVPQKFFPHGVQNLSISLEQSYDQTTGYRQCSVRPPLEEATGTFPSRVSVVDDRLKREGKDSPNTKYRSRSALLQERASKLVSGSGELTTRVEPAMIGCEA